MTDSQASTTPPPFEPDWVTGPGDAIEEMLEERSWTQAELAERTGFTRKHVNDLVKGRASVTADTALRLEAIFGAPADFWLRLEAFYRECLERRRRYDALRNAATWLKELPLNQMVKLGWVDRVSHRGQQVSKVLSFFGVASVEAWRRQYETPLAAFRASDKLEKKVGAVAAWLRKGELDATEIRCSPFAKAGFTAALKEARALTNESAPAVLAPRLVELCAAHGVAVVFVPAPVGCPASGATRWLSPEKAMLILSLRHKTDDHLWFTFFHEAAHILIHGKKMQFVDLDDAIGNESEEEADRFARDRLIAPANARRLKDLARAGKISKAAVCRFATEQGIAPGIVVGRMQKEGWLPWTHLNGLKVRYSWASMHDKRDR
jgi:HTH-type transcriptional regulator/antitoxin HigA